MPSPVDPSFVRRLPTPGALIGSSAARELQAGPAAALVLVQLLAPRAAWCRRRPGAIRRRSWSRLTDGVATWPTWQCSTTRCVVVRTTRPGWDRTRRRGRAYWSFGTRRLWTPTWARGAGRDVGGRGRRRAVGLTGDPARQSALHFGTSGTSSNEVRDERLANSGGVRRSRIARRVRRRSAALGRMKATIGNRNVGPSRSRKALDVAAVAVPGISPSELLELVGSPPYGSRRRRVGWEIEVGDHVAVAGDRRGTTSSAHRGVRPTAGSRRPSSASIADTEGRPSTRAKEAGEGAPGERSGLERGRDRGPVHRGPGVGCSPIRLFAIPRAIRSRGTIGRRLIWTVLR